MLSLPKGAGQNWRARSLCLFALCLCFSNAHAATPSFQGLGQIAGDNTGLSAEALSADGSTVVGHSGLFSNGAGPGEAFRWTANTGAIGLGILADGDGPISSWAGGVSADGSVVVGRSSWGDPLPEIPFPAYAKTAFIWTASTGLVGLADQVASPADEQVFGVTADGKSVLVSDGAGGLAWWDGGATLTPVTGLDGWIRDLSADGRAAVGGSSNLSPTGEFGSTQAALWTGGNPNGEPYDVTGLGFFPSSAEVSIALGISADGKIVVGNSWVGQFDEPPPPDSRNYGTEAFRWTAETDMVGLGDLLGAEPGPQHRSSATAVSADGSVIVGAAAGTDGITAFVWNETQGLRSVAEVLASMGLSDAIAGWTLENAIDVSADGTVILGNGTNPQGLPEPWIAAIPEPASLIVMASLVVLVRGRESRPHL